MDLRYFGTDGVRGRAFVSPLSLDECSRWGHAWGRVARLRGIAHLVLGWDPRQSSEPIAKAFLRGLDSSLQTTIIGMVPTPAVAWSTAQMGDAWGLMISASHNPPEDNGIKGFDQNGEKLSEEDELALEEAFEATFPVSKEDRDLILDQKPMEAYLAHLQGLDLGPDLKLVVDCAHGATASWAPSLIRGAGVDWMGIPADGSRINVGVGSTHLEALQTRVRDSGALAGIAFDGDGDRCLFVDPLGQLVDGDQLLWLMVQDLLDSGHSVPGVVGTLMTNGGFEAALKDVGVVFVRTPVGDKFMLRELARRGWDLAAEASSHIIQKHLGPSGDGLSTALTVLHAILRRSPSERWSWRFRPWPLRLVNIQAHDRVPLESCSRLLGAQDRLESRYGSSIRIVIRWSGTEPKLRLMVEAREESQRDEALESLEASARADLGL